MTDIAKAAGVSQSTVSNILGRNKTSSFPKATVDKVFATAEELGYTPQQRQSKTNVLASKRILVLATRLTNPYYPCILQSIEHEANKNGLHVVCGDTYHLPKLEQDYLDMALEMNFLAVIYLFPPDNPQALERALERIPIITICDNVPDSKADQVELNNFRSGCIAAEHLISLGHRNIVMLTTPMDRNIARLSRVKGVENLIHASENCTLHIISDFIDTPEGEMAIENNFDYSVGYHLAQDPHIVKCGATAIIATNDMVAIGAMDALSEKGFRIPEDYSIIGFDNTDFGRLPYIALTSVSQQKFRIGRLAVQRLLEKIGGDCRQTTDILQPELVIRSSCRKI